MALVLVTSARASAAILGAFNEVCQLDTNATDYAVAWGSGASPTRCTALPAIETTILPAGPGNRCALRYGLTTASSMCAEAALTSAQSTLNLTCRLHVVASDTAGLCEGGTNDGSACTQGSLADVLGTACPSGICVAGRTLATFRNSGGTTGAILRVVRYNATQVQLQAKFRTTTATTCNGSTEPTTNITRDDTPCTATLDPDCENQPRDLTLCPEHNHCEARCDPQSFASALIPIGTDELVTIQQANDATTAQVSVSLWAGAGTVPSLAYSDGGGFKKVGLCSGGTNDAEGCSTTADCASPGTCDASRKITLDRLSLGSDDTAPGAWDYVLDGCVWSNDATPLTTNSYWETLTGTGSPEVGDWTTVGTNNGCADGTASLYKCLNDGATEDQAGSALDDNHAAKPTANIQWSTPGAQPTPAPTPLAVLAEWVVQQTDTTAPKLKLDFQNGTTIGSRTSDFTEWQVAFSDHGSNPGGATNGYHVAPPSLTTNSTILANLGTLVSVLDHGSGASASSNDARVTALTASVLRATAAPVVPNVIPDRDMDGEKTVCAVGDSIFDNADFQAVLTGLLFEPTNLIFGTMGNTTIRDAANNWDNLLEGLTSGFLKAKRATRGNMGRTCDVTFVQMGTNEPHAGTHGDPTNLTTMEGGLGQAGFCETASGAGTGQGLPCVCSDIPKLTRDPAVGYGFCVTKGTGGAAFGTHCFDQVGNCACTANADCTFAGGTGACVSSKCVKPCATNADCVGVGTGACTSGACNTGLGDACKPSRTYAEGRSTSCVAGCDNAPGCSGVCIQEPTLAMAEADWTTIKTKTAAHVPPNPTPAATPAGQPIVVYINPPSVVRPTASTSNSGILGCWSGHKHFVQTLGLWLREQSAADPTMRFLDMDAVFDRDCPSRQTTGTNSCASDGVHPPPFGQQIMAQAVVDCATNTDSKSARTGITHDGVCDTVTTHQCTNGRVGYACTNDAWCDIWRCNFSSP